MTNPKHSRRSAQHDHRWYSRHKVAASAAVLSATGLMLSTTATWSAWTVTDTNSGNQIKSGTVCIMDSQDGQSSTPLCGSGTSTALINVSNITPSYTANFCIAVDYTNTVSSPATAAVIFSNGAAISGDTISANLDIEIQKGSDSTYTTFSQTSAPACANFTAASTVLASESLSSFISSSSTSGDAPDTWTAGSMTIYEVTITATSSLGLNEEVGTSGFPISFQISQS